MIRSFGDRQTERIWNGRYTGRLDPRLQRTALRKPELINAATSLEDLRVPPGNRLEQLSGTRAGQFSIRVNAQWRICFRWREGGAENVELVDYH